jgi:hypothetical protein
MGVFKQVVFGDCNPFKGGFLGAFTLPVPSEAGAPCTVAEGTTPISIGDLPVLEHTPRILGGPL